MRTAHWKAHLLPLLLLSLHSVSVCLAAICIFDRTVTLIDRRTIATAKEQPTGKDWEPIRIVASTKDLQGPSKYCAAENGTIHERSAKETDLDCIGVFDTLTAEKSKIAMGILERAIALHTDRLLVKRAVGPLVIPDFSEHPLCKLFNVPAEHHTTGVANADVVLYVAYVGESGVIGALSLGMMCAKSADGRPIAGHFTFGDGNTKIRRRTVRFAAHQIAHILGFSYNQMISRNMIMNKNVRDKLNPVSVVKLNKTKEMAQAHYGCSEAEGMVLQDGQKYNETLSHWGRYNARDELMADPTGGPGASFMGFYTSMTMAFFEDMGFYRANFTMAEHMEYGYKAGCNFLTGKCMENGKTKWPHMFCNFSEFNIKVNFCTTDRAGLGACAFLDSYSLPLPEYFHYFATPQKGELLLSLTDYCPVKEQLSPHGCTDSVVPEEMPGSLVGMNSVCLDGSELKVKRSNKAVPAAGVCAEILCEGGSVKVRYLGDKNNKWHECPEGKSLTPSLTSAAFVSGTITCPKYKEVCTVGPDGSSLVAGATKHNNWPYDGSSVSFGLIPSVAFLVVSFAGYLTA